MKVESTQVHFSATISKKVEKSNMSPTLNLLFMK